MKQVSSSVFLAVWNVLASKEGFPVYPQMEVFIVRKGVFIVILTTIFVVCCLLLYLIETEVFSKIDPLNSSEIYRINSQERIPRGKIPLLLVTEKHIILFYDYEGIINVYGHTGSYMYGFQVESLKKGTGDIAFHNEQLYIRACGNKMYIFEDKRLVSCFRSTDDYDAYKEAEAYMAGDPCRNIGATSFYIVNNQIMKSIEGGPFQTVIILPQENTDISFLAFFILLGIAGITNFLRKPKFTPGT